MQTHAPRMGEDHLRLLIPLLILAAAAWLVTITWSRDMGSMPGTMGLGMASFMVMWTLMMAAMMLPSAAPLATLYVRTLQIQRYRQVALFVAGYVLVWSLSSLPAFGLA